MKIRLKKKDNKYAQVHVDMLRNKLLSLKAKGLGSVLESYSDDFNLSVKSIEFGSSDGPKSIKTAIKELERGYYLFRFQTHNSAGRFETYWAFDSERLDASYLCQLIKELEKVDLITPININSPGYHNGGADTIVTGVSLTGCGESVDGQIVDGESTTYNNINNNNKVNKISHIKFDNFKNFKNQMIQNYQNKIICYGPSTFLGTTPISITSLGYLHNKITNKDLIPDDAKEVWEWMFNNQTKLGISNEESNQKIS